VTCNAWRAADSGSGGCGAPNLHPGPSDWRSDTGVTSLVPALSCSRPNPPFAELVRLSPTSIADEMREEHECRLHCNDHLAVTWLCRAVPSSVARKSPLSSDHGAQIGGVVDPPIRFDRSFCRFGSFQTLIAKAARRCRSSTRITRSTTKITMTTLRSPGLPGGASSRHDREPQLFEDGQSFRPWVPAVTTVSFHQKDFR
jgi:hypothetical protein